jgi:rubredoxin
MRVYFDCIRMYVHTYTYTYTYTCIQLGELKVFACGNCGYEMMPAKGREGKFFPKNFKCPICGERRTNP